MLSTASRPLAIAATLAAFVGVTSVPVSAEASEPAKRAVPDFDGRGEAATTAGDVLLWIPRVAMSPVYLVSEYVLRQPIGFLITEAERADVASLLVDFFTFGGSSAGLIPTFLFDFGLEAGALPSAGFYFFWDDMAFDGHDLRLRAAFGGSDWYEVDFTNRFSLGEHARIAASFDYSRRKDWVFAGIGPSFDEDAIGRFGMDRVEGALDYEHELGVRSELTAGLRLAHYSFFSASCCEDPSIQARIDEGVYGRPSGLDASHTQIAPELKLALDSRAVRPGDESGVRAEVFGSVAVGLGDDSGSFARVGGQLGGFLDLYNTRVIGLRLHTEVATPLGDHEVPFSELTLLGGSDPMRAFAEGRARLVSGERFLQRGEFPSQGCTSKAPEAQGQVIALGTVHSPQMPAARGVSCALQGSPAQDPCEARDGAHIVAI